MDTPGRNVFRSRSSSVGCRIADWAVHEAEMTTCCVYGCGNNSDKTRGVTYLEFPKTEELCKKWLLACRRRKKIPLKTARVCSEHFRPLVCGSSGTGGSAAVTRQQRQRGCRRRQSQRKLRCQRSPPLPSLSSTSSSSSSPSMSSGRCGAGGGKTPHLVLDLHCPTEKLPIDRPQRITRDEANDITDCSYEDRNLEKMVTKLEDTIQYLEKENRYLLHNLEALEELNTRTLIEINALKNKLGC
ncbi:hypothetical protein AAG570_006167 [Ranatra chinensis]|uniref:THAP-type domain-containing protein n=1 Tax=Ranatra chinensis TaxID=642074 RepID=A0ABD0YA45_9HEMI